MGVPRTRKPVVRATREEEDRQALVKEVATLVEMRAQAVAVAAVAAADTAARMSRQAA